MSEEFFTGIVATIATIICVAILIEWLFFDKK